MNNSNSIQDFFKKIPKLFYINLEKRTDRNEQFLSNFYEPAKYNIERIKAFYEPDNGAVGCLKSHIYTLKKAKELELEYVLICEDDLVIINIIKLNSALERFLKEVKTWDVILIAHGNTQIIKNTYNINFAKITTAQTTSGYIIKKAYIDKLLNIYEDSLKKYEKTNKWIDNYCTDQSWKILQSKDNWYAIFPRIAKQRESYSDIMKHVVKYNC